MKPKIAIVGGGLAGLVAAIHLEEAGIPAVLFEATDRIGGRMRTDTRDGLLLDHGFQVLLTAYQEVNRYLDLEALELEYFRPGALIFRAGKQHALYDPLREPAKAVHALLSPIGNLSDKWLVGKLALQLRRQPLDQLFTNSEQSTQDWLRAYGFSTEFIETFFRPFFGGIFLERHLSTPADMFRFVFKMFSIGYAAVPRAGIEAVPRQLERQLHRTDIRVNQRVQAVEGHQLRFTDGSSDSFDAIILACPYEGLLPNLASDTNAWHATSCFYFRAPGATYPHRLIGLVANAHSLINNFCAISEVAHSYAQEGQLLSVTLRELPDDPVQTAQAVAEELRQLLRQPALELEFAAHFPIPQALPALTSLYFEQQPLQTRLTEHVFLAGDHQLNASQDAALRSGRNAALGVLEAIRPI